MKGCLVILPNGNLSLPPLLVGSPLPKCRYHKVCHCPTNIVAPVLLPSCSISSHSLKLELSSFCLAFFAATVFSSPPQPKIEAIHRHSGEMTLFPGVALVTGAASGISSHCATGPPLRADCHVRHRASNCRYETKPPFRCDPIVVISA